MFGDVAFSFYVVVVVYLRASSFFESGAWQERGAGGRVNPVPVVPSPLKGGAVYPRASSTFSFTESGMRWACL